MLEKPDIPDEIIMACLQEEYDLAGTRLDFLPLGADINSSAYRVEARNGAVYFVKLRSGVFDEMTVAIPKLLSERGIHAIIPPLATRQGLLWANLESYKLIMYPFIDAQDGYRIRLSAANWQAFGAALRRIHATELPAQIAGRLRRETFSPQWREMFKSFLQKLGPENSADELSRRLAAFLKDHAHLCADLLDRTETLACSLRERTPDFVLCHADVHAGNVLVDAAGKLYIVDWDDPILAPRERDLMFIGNAQGFVGYTPAHEETLFYQGYGQIQVDGRALAYYRYERIIVDLALYCQQVFNEAGGRADREQGLKYLMSNFLPGNTLDLAYKANTTSRQA